MIVIDTSALISSLCGARESSAQLRRLVLDGERVAMSAIVLYEWLRGPRTEAEIAAQEDLWPVGQVVPFGSAEAIIAARLYSKVRSPRGREIDLALAATAIARDAALWTLNTDDFRDIPGLERVSDER